MDSLCPFAESNFEGGENYVAAQDVTRGVPGEEADLCGKTAARLAQLNLQVEEINVSRTRKRTYDHTISFGQIFDSNQLCILRTEYGEE